MAMRTPSDVDEFRARFSDWPQNSLLQRVNIKAGSQWAIRDIETFQILRLRTEKASPRWLQDRLEEAEERVEASTEIQRAIQLLHTNWKGLNRADLIRASGSFGAFFSLLAEMIEGSSTPMPHRHPRSSGPPEGQMSQPSRESSSSGQASLPLTPLEPAADRMRGRRSSDQSEQSSYNEQVPNNDSSDELEQSRDSSDEDHSLYEEQAPNNGSSDELEQSRDSSEKEHSLYDEQGSNNVSSGESEQSRYDEQVKAETVTNACLYHFLECVTENSRPTGKIEFRLEWQLTQDTFKVRTPRSQFSSKNDGGLVHRSNASGKWKRKGGISYCSVEAKSRYDITTKPMGTQGQEAAHMVGMYAQRYTNLGDRNVPPWNVIPLITASQNNAFLLLGTFPPEYAEYFKTGKQSDYLAFAEIQEFGPFDLKNPVDFEAMSVMIVALVLKLEALGPLPGS